MKPVYSIVCCVNNHQILNDWLWLSLRQQSWYEKCELLLLDNRAATFRSAAAAYNNAAASTSGEYVIFAHQDVRLLGRDWLERAYEWLRMERDWGVAGVAGMGPGPGRYRKLLRSYVAHPGEPIPAVDSRVPEPVLTLDEVLLVVPREVLARVRFDEGVCDGWHLYGVDYALQCAQRGLRVLVLPLPVQHRSRGIAASPRDLLLWRGHLPPPYWHSLERLLAKYRKEYARIPTTCGVWVTGLPVAVQRGYYLCRAVGGFVKRWAGAQLFDHHCIC